MYTMILNNFAQFTCEQEEDAKFSVFDRMSFKKKSELAQKLILGEFKFVIMASEQSQSQSIFKMGFSFSISVIYRGDLFHLMAISRSNFERQKQ